MLLQGEYFIYDCDVLNTQSIGHFGEMSGDYSDYRNVNIHNLLGITPYVIMITDWLKMLVSYMRVGTCYDSPRYTTWYNAF